MKKLALLALTFVAALLSGCADENTQTAVVLYEYPDAKLLAYITTGSSLGVYTLCDKGQLVVVLTDRFLGVGTRKTQKIPTDKGKCSVS